MIASRTTDTEAMIEQLRSWLGDSEYQSQLDKLREQMITIVNDAADARELSDDRLLTIQRQAQALDKQLGHIASLDRTMATIGMVCEMPCAAWIKIDSIREVLSAKSV